jgi:nitroreductase
MNYSQNVHKTHILETIKQRRSIGQMTQEQPDREQIEQLLEAATYAPNHHITEPWHFFVVTGAARERLGTAMAEALEMRLSERQNAKSQVLLQKEQMKPLRAPVIITVAVPAVAQQEDFLERIEAASAAVQNMLLTAQEMGMASIWRTGNAACDSHVKHWFGLAPDDHIVAFLYIGFSNTRREERVPTPFAQKTTWLD